MLFRRGRHRYRLNTETLYLYCHCPAQQFDSQDKPGKFLGANQNPTDTVERALADPHTVPSLQVWVRGESVRARNGSPDGLNFAVGY